VVGWETGHLLEVCKDLEPGKSVDVEGGIWAGRTEAETEIRRSQERVRPSIPAR
jgi:inorganic pyrophosphatase